MDVQLQELVERIRKDGVDTAETKAAEIIKNAEAKAAAIVSSAQKEAERLAKKAEEDAARSEAAAVSAIQQSARNLLISFRDGISGELESLVKQGVAKAYGAQVLETLVPQAVKSWIAATGSDDLAVILSKADLETLEAVFAKELKAELAKGLTLRPDSMLSGGFRIGEKDGSAYYDFSAEAVADLFSSYLNPRVAEIMKAASKEL